MHRGQEMATPVWRRQSQPRTGLPTAITTQNAEPLGLPHHLSARQTQGFISQTRKRRLRERQALPTAHTGKQQSLGRSPGF